MTKSILSKNFILSSYAVIALVTLSFAAALFENSYEQYIYILISDIILSEATVFACTLCKADLKLTFCFLIIHHIGIIIHCILGSDMIKYILFDAVGFVFAFLFLICFEYLKSVKSIKYKAVLTVCVSINVLLVAVLLLFGDAIGGTKAWISLFGISVQLTELLKLIFLAYITVVFCLPDVSEKTRFLYSSVFSLFNVVSLTALNELGTAMVICLVYICLLAIFYKKRYFIASLFSVLLIIGIFILFDILICNHISSSHAPNSLAVLIYRKVLIKVNTRAQIWLNPSALDFDSSYQINSAQEAITQGGLFGSELKNPVSVPVAESDFVFTAIIENLGLITGIFIVILFFIILVRGLRLSMKASRPFDSIAVVTSVLFIVISSFLMILGSTRSFFLTGVPIAFLSEGGTQTVVNIILLSVILNSTSKSIIISQISKKIKDKVKYKYNKAKRNRIEEKKYENPQK